MTTEYEDRQMTEGDSEVPSLADREFMVQREDINLENISPTEYFRSKDEITGFAEDFSYKEISKLSSSCTENDSNLLDIFLKAVIADEQVEIANKKYAKECEAYEEARVNSKKLWSLVEEKARIVANVIEMSKKEIGDAIKNMERLETERSNIEKEMKAKEQAAIDAKEKSESELRRANEMMALAEINFESAQEALAKAIAQEEIAKEEVKRAHELVEEKRNKFKTHKKTLKDTEKYAKEEIEKADHLVKGAIDASYELEVKAAAEIKTAKKEKDVVEKNCKDYDEVVNKEESKMLVAESVAKRAREYRESIAAEAQEAGTKLSTKSKHDDLRKDFDRQKHTKKQIMLEPVESCIAGENDIGECAAKNNLRARLNFLKSMNPENE